MKLLHISDLHLGKRLSEFSLIDDQRYILDEILGIIDREAPDAVIIAGDIYDKTVPSAEAVSLFDGFLVSLVSRRLEVFAISGNHDSAERVAFGSRIMDASGIHLSPVYNGKAEPFVRADAYGEVRIFMLPFIKPANLRQLGFEDADSYTDAMRAAVSRLDTSPEARNILITHQFVTGASRSESEEVSVGGTDNVDASVFDPFDYVALGHLHTAQSCVRESIRYCGTPLKYSVSETEAKSVTVVDLHEKGTVGIRTVPLKPRRELVRLKGTYDELTLRSFYENTTYREDYIHAVLTDEEDIPNAIGKLRVIYPNLMKLEYDNTRTRRNTAVTGDAGADKKNPFDLFSDFYRQQNNREMCPEQEEFMRRLIEKTREDRT